jgi:hypothetical protein
VYPPLLWSTPTSRQLCWCCKAVKLYSCLCAGWRVTTASTLFTLQYCR